MVLGGPAFQEQRLQHLAPLSSPVLTAAFPPALHGKACLSSSISAEGVAGGQAAIKGHPSRPLASHLDGMSVVSV